MNNTLQRLFPLIAVVSLAVFITNCSQVQSDNTNVETIRGLYDAFATGDVPTVLAAMSPDIIWNEAENFPYDDGNPYIGPDAVLNGVFARIMADFETFQLVDQTIYPVGENMVLATGRYIGTHRVTGKNLDAQKAHLWWLEDGMITRFQQYADTKQAWEVGQ
jgi:ketosteroid isomerase-like protein